MKAAKVTLTATILAAALGLALGLSVAPAQAGVDCTKPKFFEHQQCGDIGGDGAGGGLSGKASRIVWTIIAGDSLEDDGVNASYVDGDGGVRTRVGGQTQPHGPGIGINLSGTGGQEPRTIRVNVTCTNPDVDPTDGEIFIGGASGCDFLNSLGVFNVQRAHMTLKARPYDVNCPDPVGGECLDVFTMGAGGSAQMGFQIFSDEGIRLDIASDIGGGDAPDPGRCLSIMTKDERDAFLDASCNTAADCNVTVMAMGVDSDGRNDSWDIVAANDTGLICSLFSPVLVIGVAENVSFTIAADPK